MIWDVVLVCEKCVLFAKQDVCYVLAVQNEVKD